jgi:hypothetical protein
MDDAARRIMHIDVIRQINPALQRIVTDRRSRFAQGCKLDLLQRAKLSSLGVEQDVGTIAQMKIIERHARLHASGRERNFVSQPSEPKASPDDGSCLAQIRI